MRASILDPITLALAAGCVGLGLLVLHQVRTPPFAGVAPTAVAASDSSEVAELRLWAMPPAADFTATIARPLFTEGRRPPRVQDTVVAAGEAAADLSVTLTAVILTPDRRIALVERKPGDTLFLTEGDNIDGWAVVEVGFEHLLLGAGDRTHQLPLRDLPTAEVATPAALVDTAPQAADAPTTAGAPPVEIEQRLVDGRLVEVLPEHAGITEGGILTVAPVSEPEPALR